MKKIFLLLAVMFFMTAVLNNTIAQDVSYTYDNQRKESMDSCMNFARNFGSQGTLEDKASFQEQFGMPVEVNTRYDVDDDVVTVYNFDNFTRIVLDCDYGRCHCRCYPKY